MSTPPSSPKYNPNPKKRILGNPHLHPPVLLPLRLLAVLHLGELVHLDLCRRDLLHDHSLE